MSCPTARPATGRDLLYLGTPALWPQWPLLPVVRRTTGALECGVLCDVRTLTGQTGYSATVFLTNIFQLPRTLDAFLRLPKEVFDTADEIAAAGWVVD